MVFMCSRSRAVTDTCKGGSGECRTASVGACKEPLRGRLTGLDCDLPMCRAHLVLGADGVQRCPAHARLAAKVAARAAAVQA